MKINILSNYVDDIQDFLDEIRIAIYEHDEKNVLEIAACIKEYAECINNIVLEEK